MQRIDAVQKRNRVQQRHQHDVSGVGLKETSDDEQRGRTGKDSIYTGYFNWTAY